MVRSEPSPTLRHPDGSSSSQAQARGEGAIEFKPLQKQETNEEADQRAAGSVQNSDALQVQPQAPQLNVMIETDSTYHCCHMR